MSKERTILQATGETVHEDVISASSFDRLLLSTSSLYLSLNFAEFSPSVGTSSLVLLTVGILLSRLGMVKIL